MCERRHESPQPIATVKEPMTEPVPTAAPPLKEEDFITDKGREMAALADGIPAYRGWTACYDFPGFINFSHPGYKGDSDGIIVCATPDWEGDDILDIQVQRLDGHALPNKGKGCEGAIIPFPKGSGRTPERLLELTKPWLDLWMPLPPLVLSGNEVLRLVNALLDDEGVVTLERALDDRPLPRTATAPFVKLIEHYRRCTSGGGK